MDTLLIDIKMSNSDNKSELLAQAQKEHAKDLASKVFDLKYVEDLNVHFCLQLFQEYLTLFDQDEITSSAAKPPPNIRRSERLINLLRRSCATLPSVRLAEAQFKTMDVQLAFHYY